MERLLVGVDSVRDAFGPKAWGSVMRSVAAGPDGCASVWPAWGELEGHWVVPGGCQLCQLRIAACFGCGGRLICGVEVCWHLVGTCAGGAKELTSQGFLHQTVMCWCNGAWQRCAAEPLCV